MISHMRQQHLRVDEWKL